MTSKFYQRHVSKNSNKSGQKLSKDNVTATSYLYLATFLRTKIAQWGGGGNGGTPFKTKYMRTTLVKPLFAQMIFSMNIARILHVTDSWSDRLMATRRISTV